MFRCDDDSPPLPKAACNDEKAYIDAYEKLHPQPHLCQSKSDLSRLTKSQTFELCSEFEVATKNGNNEFKSGYLLSTGTVKVDIIVSVAKDAIITYVGG